jgi:hypothetical protein
MKLADDRPKIEEQLKLDAPKMANVASLNVATAQRLLSSPKSPTEQSAQKSKPPAPEQYKRIENDLITCLKSLRDKAASYAAGTIGALNDTVEDIKSVLEQAKARRGP